MRKRILFVQQTLRPPGGAAAVAAWMLEALKHEYEVTVLCESPPDFGELNRFYGTSLRQSDVSAIYPNPFVRGLFRLDPDRHSIQPAAYLMRICQRYRRNYDLVVAAGMEEMDLGGPGLIYVHYPHLARFWTKYRDSAAGFAGLIRGETRPWIVLAGYSINRMKQNTMLANSDWTGRRIYEAYGILAQTLYPPVAAAASPLPWQARENSFVSAGRFQARKRMDWLIQMLGEIRGRHPIRLHLVGTRDEGPAASRYYLALQELAKSNREWVYLHENLPRQDLLDLMSRCRYGIHALKDEHFGIAPAETLMAGCIPFVHDSGGQVEIVGHDRRLCYQDGDALAKIRAVMDSEAAQADIQHSLTELRQRFSVEHFIRRIREAVETAIG